MLDDSTVTDAEQATKHAVDQAVLASVQGTFAVGGAIIRNDDGTIVQAIHNNVLMPTGTGQFLLHDPTAHGERQLVDWYYANCASLDLPAPSALTVVTSLDPCAMCAGALLTAGFNVAVSAIDTFAGINYTEDFTFPTLTPTLRSAAQQTWGYYGVRAPLERAWVGGTEPIFAGETISAATFELSLLVFTGSVNNIRASDNSSGLAPSAMTDPATLPAESPVRTALSDLYPGALTIRSSQPRFPGPELAPALLSAATLAQQRGAAFNAVALLDPFGNLLTCTGGQEQLSPIRTAFLEATRDYAVLRWTLMNSSETAVQTAAASALTHPKYCTFVHLSAPDPSTPQAVMTFGAYGSTMEGPIPQAFPSSFQYVLPPADATTLDVAALACQLPPFYVSDVQIAPMQVLDPALVDACSMGG